MFPKEPYRPTKVVTISNEEIKRLAQEGWDFRQQIVKGLKMPAKGWKKNQDENLNKQAEVAEAAEKKTVKTEIIEITAGVVPAVDPRPDTSPTVQETSAESRKRLPKILIVTVDKHGNSTTKEYTCAQIRLFQNTETTLTDGQPTKRKDKIDLSIEATVVGID